MSHTRGTDPMPVKIPPVEDAIEDGADPTKTWEIAEATNEMLRKMGDEHDVEITSDGEQAVLETLLTFSDTRPRDEWVDGLHESMVDPGDGCRTDVGLAVGATSGGEHPDVRALVNSILEEKYRSSDETASHSDREDEA